MKNLILLIPLLPFIGFLINGLGRNYLSRGLSGFIGSATVLASFAISCYLFFNLDHLASLGAGVHNARILPPYIYQYFDFINTAGLHIPFAFQIDQLSVLFLLIIT